MLLSVLSVMPFMVCMFWCVIFLVEYSNLTKAQRTLLGFLGVGAALYFCHGQYFLNHGRLDALSDTVYAFCNIAVFPVFYLYIRRLTVAGRLPWKCYLILLPALVIALWTAIVYIVGGEDITYRQEVRMTVGKIIFVVQILLVSFYGWKRLRQFDQAVDDFYSNKEDRELRLFGIMAFVLLACALASTVVSSMGREFFSDSLALLTVPSCLFSAVLFTIAYVGYKQKFDADALEKDILEYDSEQTPLNPVKGESHSNPEQVSHSVSSSSFSEEDIDQELGSAYKDQHRCGMPEREALVKNSEKEEVKTEAQDSNESPGTFPEEEPLEDSSLLGERLKELIEKDHIYLDINLKLTDVAAKLHIGRSTLSAFINQHMGVSFSDFINAKRIDHAKGLIKKEPSMSLMEISEQSGFASPSSFYRAFKKYVGVTPKDWILKGDS